MLKHSLLITGLLFSLSANAIPNFYQQQADELGVDATKIYAVALANAGVQNEFGQYYPWPWSVTVDGYYYQFKTKGKLFEFLKKHQSSKQKITYGIAGILLNRQTDNQLWYSLDVDYQIQLIGKKLKQFTCSYLSQCLAYYRNGYRHKQYKVRVKRGGIKVPPISSDALNTIIASVSKETGVEQALLHAVISQESAYKVSATSSAGAMGLMQLMPKTARYLGLSKSEFYDPYKNIKAGANFLKEQLANFNGRLDLALAAYNAGPGAVRKYDNKVPPYKETQKYVPNVIGYYRYFKKKLG